MTTTSNNPEFSKFSKDELLVSLHEATALLNGLNIQIEALQAKHDRLERLNRLLLIELTGKKDQETDIDFTPLELGTEFYTTVINGEIKGIGLN